MITNNAYRTIKTSLEATVDMFIGEECDEIVKSVVNSMCRCRFSLIPHLISVRLPTIENFRRIVSPSAHSTEY